MTGESLNQTALAVPRFGIDTTGVHELKQRMKKLERLDTVNCRKAYASSIFVSSWGDVAVVTSANRTYPVSASQKVGVGQPGLDWMCSHTECITGPFGHCTNRTCNLNGLLATADNWPMTGSGHCYNSDNSGRNNCERIEYCLAEPRKEHCKVNISVSLLWIVVVCNTLKTLSLLTVALSASFEPLATVGDAISSYLRRPDPSTEGLGPLSAEDILWRSPLRIQDAKCFEEHYSGRACSSLIGMSQTNGPVIQRLGLGFKLVPYKYKTRYCGRAVSYYQWWLFFWL